MSPRHPSVPPFEVRGIKAGEAGPLDFTLAAGACLALSGPSGAGKTRLLRAIADLDPHAGECYLDGVPASDFAAPAWRARVSFLAAESAWWGQTVAAHLPTMDTRLAGYRQALDLSPAMLAAPPARLSSGQRQRAALLRLLAGAPDVLLLDEPTANLDAANIERVEALLTAYCESRGACAVWVGHDAAQRARVADHHIALDHSGRVSTCT